MKDQGTVSSGCDTALKNIVILALKNTLNIYTVDQNFVPREVPISCKLNAGHTTFSDNNIIK